MLGSDAVHDHRALRGRRSGAGVPPRFRERGRLAPAGLEYRGSWVASDLRRCYQVMECDDRALLDQWMGAWDDLVRFEVVEVITSAEAAEAVDRDPQRP